mgnify:CR=1 FL=1
MQPTEKCYFCLSPQAHADNVPFFKNFHICPECIKPVFSLDSVSLNSVLLKNENPQELYKKLADMRDKLDKEERDAYSAKKDKQAKVLDKVAALEKETTHGYLRYLKQSLLDKVMGQDHVVSVVASKLLVHSLKTEKSKPLSFFFAGPTGVGKTELTQQIAHNMNVDFVKFDMSEYKHSHNISRMIGSPPSYVGYGRPVALERFHGRKGVILFDEIEKAHDDVYDVFLQLLDKGTITTGAGKELNLTNCVVVFTSNLGVSEVKEQGRAIGLVSDNKQKPEQVYEQAINNHFRPELINRIDAILFFNSLTKEHLTKVLGKFTGILNDRLNKAHGVSFEMGQVLLDKVLDDGFNPLMGARPMARTLEKYVTEPIAEQILLEGQENCTMTLDLVDGAVKITSVNPKEPNKDRDGNPKSDFE